MSFELEDLPILGKAISSIKKNISPAVAKLFDAIKERYEFKRFDQFVDKNSGNLASIEYKTSTSTHRAEFHQPTVISQEITEYIQAALETKEKQVIKQQVNIDKIIINAADELKLEEDVSSEPVDEDWLSDVFERAKLANSEYMQKLWGKILAGEVKNPGSYSMKAVHTLQLMGELRSKVVYGDIS